MIFIVFSLYLFITGSIIKKEVNIQSKLLKINSFNIISIYISLSLSNTNSPNKLPFSKIGFISVKLGNGYFNKFIILFL